MENMTDLEQAVVDYAHDRVIEIHRYSPEKFENVDYYDINDEIFNRDYYIIGTYNAKQFMGGLAFECIDIVRTYEYENFGEYHTDISCPEKVVNMFAYIIGEECIKDVIDNFLSSLPDS
tara:strand:+ start:474 stop:830 length:357 start_codon:yes stop_codon:yes gene_type:complete